MENGTGKGGTCVAARVRRAFPSSATQTPAIARALASASLGHWLGSGGEPPTLPIEMAVITQLLVAVLAAAAAGGWGGAAAYRVPGQQGAQGGGAAGDATFAAAAMSKPLESV